MPAACRGYPAGELIFRLHGQAGHKDAGWGSAPARPRHTGEKAEQWGGCHAPQEPPMPDPWEVRSQVAPLGHQPQHPPAAGALLGCAQLDPCPRFLPPAGAAAGLAAPSLLINTSSARRQPGQGPHAAIPVPQSPMDVASQPAACLSWRRPFQIPPVGMGAGAAACCFSPQDMEKTQRRVLCSGAQAAVTLLRSLGHSNGLCRAQAQSCI